MSREERKLMDGQEEGVVFVNRPVAREWRFEYQPPPPTSNPVLRGLPLYYLAQLVTSSRLVQSILWTLNGFGKLRDRAELDGVEPRYLPDVVRTSASALALASPPADDGVKDRQGENAYLAALNAEDWPSRAPHIDPKTGGSKLWSCLDYHAAYRAGTFTPVDVVEALLPLVRRGKEGKVEGKHATAFLCVKAELVRKAAEESAERWRRGEGRGLLDGVVMAVKDEEDLTGHARSLGTTMDFRHADGATSYCVQKLLDAGAICLGKTTMHEMGMDTTNNNPNHGTPVNPYNERYYCGGSSGGSAYAVAAGLVPFAMGNDGGGSIRIPSAYCGLFGLKTTHGRVSVRPTSNLARSTGVAGPIAANMVDLEIAYRVMAEPDKLDPGSALFSPPAAPAKPQSRRKVLGICRPWFDRADKAVREACYAALEYLEQTHGYATVEISLPLLDDGQRAHALTIMTEVLSGCSPATLSRLTPANKILLSVASQTGSLDFLQAQKLRNLLMQHLAHLHTLHPGLIIVTPTTPNAGWPFQPQDLTYGVSDGNMQIRNMEYAWLANFCGCPALSAPVGFLAPREGCGEGVVPVGLMGMGEWGCEDGLVGFGYEVEGWLQGNLRGGRARARGWEDVFGMVGK